MKIRMCTRTFLVTISLFLAVAAGVFAQNRDFMSHVTQIQIESRNNLIRLSWVDSPDARGPVYIFRSARPFSGPIPANIRPVVVRYGQQYYIDDTDDMGNVHYFIAASDAAGRRFDLILPRINSISVNFVHTQERDEAIVVEPPVTRELTMGISNLRAVQDGDRVVITYDVSGPRRNAILYRSMQPVRQPQDLLNAVIVQSRITSPFVDFPVSGINWYYTVIHEEEIATGNVGIRPGVNTTVTPVIIASAHELERSIRPIPLPVLTIRNIMPEGFFADIPVLPLSTGTAEMLHNTQMPQRKPHDLKEPRVFIIDLEAPAGGEESVLYQIIAEYFVKFDWENARIRLQHYLSLPRSRDVEARARFYFGQTLYFTGRFREALMEFLFFRIHHFAEANNWIDAVLTAMVH
ncbi:MAG: hypothetical protein LBC80_00980 [Treponema sp.]|jgi:hypothetical protein|nr:hypothetical protein [Treponema sp.]